MIRSVKRSAICSVTCSEENKEQDNQKTDVCHQTPVLLSAGYFTTISVSSVTVTGIGKHIDHSAGRNFAAGDFLQAAPQIGERAALAGNGQHIALIHLGGSGGLGGNLQADGCIGGKIQHLEAADLFFRLKTDTVDGPALEGIF